MPYRQQTNYYRLLDRSVLHPVGKFSGSGMLRRRGEEKEKLQKDEQSFATYQRLNIHMRRSDINNARVISHQASILRK